MSEPRVVRIDDILDDPAHSSRNQHGERFEARLGAVGRALGTSQVGMTLTEVAPGKAAWPRHFHHVNEEVFWVLAGMATLRYGDTERELGPGEIVCVPPGTGIPFQIVNRGDERLRYMAISGLNGTDVFEYPDSGKVGFVTGGGGPMRGPHARHFFVHEAAGVAYWTDE